MRTDFENLEDGATVVLHPRPDNPLHNRSVEAFYAKPYFYCIDGNPEHGADYFSGNALAFVLGFEVASDS